MTKELLLTMEGTRGHVARAISQAMVFLESHALPPRSLYQVNLALEEILTNIVRHGCQEGTTNEIHVRVELKSAEVIIECVDDCCEFNPLDAAPPDFDSPLLECEPGGLGIHLVKEATSSMEYCRDQGRNVLRVRVDVPTE
ncbi:MAG: ATP-binding protein [Deltaproteobacteria bacterium]